MNPMRTQNPSENVVELALTSTFVPFLKRFYVLFLLSLLHNFGITNTTYSDIKLMSHHFS